MSIVRQRSSQRRVFLALALLLTGAIAACDASATAPTQLRPAQAKPAAIVGDTLGCLRGWVLITGAYVCN